MAETVTLSSPSLVLNVNVSDPVPSSSTPAQETARQPLAATKDAAKATQTLGVTKRKQSKSRNGMLAALSVLRPCQHWPFDPRAWLTCVSRMHHLQEQASEVR